MDYTELAQIRAERQQREAQQRVQDMRTEYASAQQLRDQQTDPDSWHFYDRECERLESEWLQAMPPEQPQIDHRLADWIGRHQSFYDRYGPKAHEAVIGALQYVARPRTSSNNPLVHGMGVEDPCSPEGLRHMETLLEMYGQQYFGVQFDPNDRVPTSEEAAQICNQTNKQWNQGLQKAVDDGRMSAQQDPGMWDRKVG